MKTPGFIRIRRFGIRTLFVVVLVIAVLLGVWKNEANRQRRALKVIAESGNFVFHHEFPYPDGLGKVDYKATPPGNAWIRKVIGDDYFQSVRMVNFSPTDAAMKQLRSLPDIDDLSIDAYRLTNDGFRELATSKNVEKLTIEHGHGLSNDCMLILTRLPKIRRLIIFDTPIDHGCIEHLAKLSSLEELFLGGTLLTADDVARLRTLLPNAYIDVNPEMGQYERPLGKLKADIMPYNSFRGTAQDPRSRE